MARGCGACGSVVDVQVSTAGGVSDTATADHYTYTPAPTINALSPSAGPLAAGTVVTITGTNLANATTVAFGNAGIATAVSCSALACTVTAPAGAAGTVAVTVTTVGGTSAASAADHYTFTATPTVTAVSPASGPAAGGTTVTITGTNLSGAAAVTFGPDGVGTAMSCTARSCTVTSPPGAAGAVDIPGHHRRRRQCGLRRRRFHLPLTALAGGRHKVFRGNEPAGFGLSPHMHAKTARRQQLHRTSRVSY